MDRQIAIYTGLLSVLLVHGPARASTYTESALVNRDDPPGYTVSYLEFAGFDWSRGTLNNVTLNMSITYGATLNYAYFDRPTNSLQAPIIDRLSINAGSFNYVATVADNDVVTPLPGPVGFSVADGANYVFADQLPTSFLATALLPGGFDGSVGVLSSYTGYLPTTLSVVTLNVKASLIYDYTPVPEPVSLLLLGGMLTAVLATQRARRGNA